MTSCSWPPAASQRRAVQSWDALATRQPSRLYAAFHSGPPWPWNELCCWPSSASHNLAVASSDAVRTVPPSGLNAAEATAPSWPSMVSSRLTATCGSSSVMFMAGSVIRLDLLSSRSTNSGHAPVAAAKGQPPDTGAALRSSLVVSQTKLSLYPNKDGMPEPPKPTNGWERATRRREHFDIA